MHIVQLCTRRDYYGGEVCLARLATGLADRGHRVSCLVRPGSELARRLAGGGVEVVTLPLRDWFDPGTVRPLAGWLADARPDVIATHLPRDWFIAAVAARGLPTAHVATRHQLAPVSWPRLKRPFLRDCGAMIAVSAAVAAGLRRTGIVPPERIRVVPNGVPMVRAAGHELRDRLGLDATTPLVGLVGRLEGAKGADVLLDAVGRLADRIGDLHVALLGGDPRGRFARGLVARAERLGLAGRVHLCGYLEGAAALVAGFTVQVVASTAEPFGLATVEALAQGVPVVATASGGSPEIVRDGQEGLLFAPGDAAGLAACLLRLLTDEGLRRRMGARGRLRHRALFTADRMVARTEAVYRAARRTPVRAGMAAAG